MTDEYATLRAAFHAGATIQAYTLMPQFDDPDGKASLEAVSGYGYWRDLDGEPRFSCHPTRYRVKAEGAP